MLVLGVLGARILTCRLRLAPGTGCPAPPGVSMRNLKVSVPSATVKMRAVEVTESMEVKLTTGYVHTVRHCAYEGSTTSEGHCAYKALNQKDTAHTKHYIRRTLRI